MVYINKPIESDADEQHYLLAVMESLGIDLPPEARAFCPTGVGGGIDNSCSSKGGLGGGNIADITYAVPKSWVEDSAKAMGIKTDDAIKMIAGGGDDASVMLVTDKRVGSISVSVKRPLAGVDRGITCNGKITNEGTPTKPSIVVDYELMTVPRQIRADPEKRHAAGREFFRVMADGVDHARSIGAAEVRLFAAGSGANSDQFRGYAIWPRMGFDAPLPFNIRQKLPKTLSAAKTVQDLHASREGTKWWRDNGVAMDLKLDLRDPTSPQMRTFDRFVKHFVRERRSKVASVGDGWLSPEDESLIDDMWMETWGESRAFCPGASPPDNSCSPANKGGGSQKPQSGDPDSKEFKDWFAGSVAVSPDGAPLQIWRGGQDRKTFDPDAATKSGGEYGIYVTTNKKYADAYAAASGRKGAKAHPYYISIRNPLYVENKGEISPKNLTKADIDRLKSQGYDSIAVVNYRDPVNKVGPDPLHKAHEIVLFDDNQIVSAKQSSSRAFCPGASPPDNSCSPANKGSGAAQPRRPAGSLSSKAKPQYVNSAKAWLADRGVSLLLDGADGSGAYKPTVFAIDAAVSGVARMAAAGIKPPALINVGRTSLQGAAAEFDANTGVVTISGDIDPEEVRDAIKSGWTVGDDDNIGAAIVIHETTHGDHFAAMGKSADAWNKLAGVHDIEREEKKAQAAGKQYKPTPEEVSAFAWNPKYRISADSRGRPAEESIRIAERVSEYAAVDPIEFVAEVRTGLVLGRRYDDEVMALYRDYGGPAVRRGRRK